MLIFDSELQYESVQDSFTFDRVSCFYLLYEEWNKTKFERHKRIL